MKYWYFGSLALAVKSWVIRVTHWVLGVRFYCWVLRKMLSVGGWVIIILDLCYIGSWILGLFCGIYKILFRVGSLAMVGWFFFACWILGVVYRALGVGHWKLGHGCQVLCIECFVLLLDTKNVLMFTQAETSVCGYSCFVFLKCSCLYLLEPPKSRYTWLLLSIWRGVFTPEVFFLSRSFCDGSEKSKWRKTLFPKKQVIFLIRQSRTVRYGRTYYGEV